MLVVLQIQQQREMITQAVAVPGDVPVWRAVNGGKGLMVQNTAIGEIPPCVAEESLREKKVIDSFPFISVVV